MLRRDVLCVFLCKAGRMDGGGGGGGVGPSVLRSHFQVGLPPSQGDAVAGDAVAVAAPRWRTTLGAASVLFLSANRPPPPLPNNVF